MGQRICARSILTLPLWKRQEIQILLLQKKIAIAIANG
jgi:hypothetical protein